MTREEALKAVDDIFNYCEEMDYSLPENERSGYKMLPDILKIRKYIIENTRPHGEWEFVGNNLFKCTYCGYLADADILRKWKRYTYDEEFPTACPNCGADMRKEGKQK